MGLRWLFQTRLKLKDGNETFEEHPILLKYKEGDNKGLGSWFTVPGSWLKVKKPETTNQRPETKPLNKSGKRGCYTKVSQYNT
jgi:hypothetical protein